MIKEHQKKLDHIESRTLGYEELANQAISIIKERMSKLEWSDEIYSQVHEYIDTTYPFVGRPDSPEYNKNLESRKRLEPALENMNGAYNEEDYFDWLKERIARLKKNIDKQNTVESKQLGVNLEGPNQVSR